MSALIQRQENCLFQLPWETSENFYKKWLIERQERKPEKRKEGGRFWRAERLSSRLQSKQMVSGLCPSAPSWCRRLGEAIRAAALAASCSRPPGHRKTAEPFFHKKKRPVSVAQALYHMLLLVEKAGQGLKKKKARVIVFSWLSSKVNASPTVNKS